MTRPLDWRDVPTYSENDLQKAVATARAQERERILVPDEIVHAEGSIGPDSVPAEYSQDAAYWYRRWLFAMKQLDEEALERIRGWPKAAADEREAIIRLASQLRATIPADHPKGARASFADYLRVTGGETP